MRSSEPGADGFAQVPPPPPEPRRGSGADAVPVPVPPPPGGWGSPLGGAGPTTGTGPAQAGLGGQLHPAAIAVWSTRQVGAFVVLAIVNPAFVSALLPILLVLVAISAVRFARFRWALTDTTLVVEQGVINRQRRVIRLERVQSVDVVRRISHRLLGVVALHVEAIGGSDTEGQLDALSPRVAQDVRTAILARRAFARGESGDAMGLDAPGGAGGVAGADAGAGRAGGAGEPVRQLAAVSRGRLVLSGLTEVNATLLAAVTGFGWQLFGERIDDLVQRAPALAGTDTVVVLVVVAVVVSLLLLVTAQVVLYWDFRLTRSNGELHVRRGLLEQRFDTIPLHRLQALRVEQNLPRRLLGFASVRADVAGKPGGGSGGTDTLLPFGRVEDARQLVARILEDGRASDVPLEPMPRRALARRVVRALVGTAVVTTAAVALAGTNGLWALPLVGVPALAAARASYRALGHAELDGLVVTRAGWWLQRTAYVPESRVQTLALRASWFQRRRRLSTLELHIARSPGLWSGPQMTDLDAGDGRALLRTYAPIVARRAQAG